MKYETFEEAQKALWPDTCPSCGYKAYIGMNEVKCITVQSCRNFDAKECQRWVDLRDEFDQTDPGYLLVNPTLDQIEFASASTVRVSKPAVFDWRQHVLSTVPINPLDANNWEYQLPPGESKQVYIGDSVVDAYGRTFRVANVDRTRDTIIIIDQNIP